jgi:hypothetical protein
MDPRQLEHAADFLWALINLHKEEEHLSDVAVMLVLRSGSIEDSTANVVLRFSGPTPEMLKTAVKVTSELMAAARKREESNG